MNPVITGALLLGASVLAGLGGAVAVVALVSAVARRLRKAPR